jgi:hypothetical protein
LISIIVALISNGRQKRVRVKIKVDKLPLCWLKRAQLGRAKFQRIFGRRKEGGGERKSCDYASIDGAGRIHG